MHPSPSAETDRPARPNSRVSIEQFLSVTAVNVFPFEFGRAYRGNVTKVRTSKNKGRTGKMAPRRDIPGGVGPSFRCPDFGLLRSRQSLPTPSASATRLM